MAHILIASLGDSPVVVTAMYDLLTRQERLSIRKVVVLCPDETMIQWGLGFIEEVLKEKCVVEAVPLPFEDANSEGECYEFLRCLNGVFSEAQKKGDTVYLSLAGGRKSMSAIMALLVPLFPCVESLYHVIDKNEASPRRHSFKSIEELMNWDFEDRCRYLFPPHEQLELVKIPYDKLKQVNDEFRARIYTLTPETLEELWEDYPVLANFVERVGAQSSTPLLEVMLTESVKQQYQRMQKHDVFHARRFRVCFEQMKYPYRLKEHIHGSFSRHSFSFHFYKRPRTAERPFFHTEPQGIHFFPKAKVERVIVSGLSIEEREDAYEPDGEKQLQAYNAKERIEPFSDIQAESSSDDEDFSDQSVLLIPLGSTPMVATQFYTLRKAQGQDIREVVLLYPAGMPLVRGSAELAQWAFDDEQIPCRSIPIPELKDIASENDCKLYEKKLEEAINDIRASYPDVQIDLALSGGRKGMAALAMFVAQRKGIHNLYHMVITDEETNSRVEDETTVSALSPSNIDRRTRTDRLFLRAYEGEGPYTKFACFKVPVLPAAGQNPG